jgi:hypothetical protein
MPLQAKQQHQVQQHAAQKPKHRRSAAQRRRRAVAQRKQRLAKQQQQREQAIPQSPVCPPAPFNSNEYLMDRFEKQYAAQQVDNAAAAQLADAAAASLEAVAEWDPSTQQASYPEPRAAAGYSGVDDGPESPVCPPAPRLDNEFYMSRFEQQLKQEATVAAAAAAAAAAPVLDAGVAEWDPLLREVTTLQHSTASSLPAMCAFADDSSSQC